ncbi:MAG: restriction endonuclease [Bdellovibrionota bacterium]
MYAGFFGVALWLYFVSFISDSIFKYISPNSTMKQWEVFGTVLFFLNPLTIVWVIDRIKKMRATGVAKRAYNAPCAHGVPRGLTALVCATCKEERQAQQRALEVSRREDDRKMKIRGEAVLLHRQELVRLTEHNVKKMEYLKSIPPRDFELAVGEMYRRLGYSVEVTPATNDKGKDAIMFRDGKKYLVECKQYSEENTVGREHLQKFFAAVTEEGAETGFVVTTSTFKKTAVQYAGDIKKLVLIDSVKLSALMREAFPEEHGDNALNVMCEECGEKVQFVMGDQPLEPTKQCANGHSVPHGFNDGQAVIQFPGTEPICQRCGRAMKLVSHKKRHFWRCVGHPACRGFGRFRK